MYEELSLHIILWNCENKLICLHLISPFSLIVLKEFKGESPVYYEICDVEHTYMSTFL